MSLKAPFPVDLSTTDFNDPEAVKAILNHLSNLVEALYQEEPRPKSGKSETKGRNQPIER